MKFAINTNSLRKSLNVKQMIKVCLDAGVDGVEWGLGPLENAAAEAREMAAASRDAGLQVLSFINGGKLWDTDDIRRWSDAVAGAGGKMLRVAHPWYAYNFDESRRQPETFPELMKKTRDGLVKLMDVGREYGLRYVLETHRASTFASPMAVPAMMQDLDPAYCGVIYDPANTFLEGFVRPRGAVELLGPFLAYLHVKNLVITQERNADGKMAVAMQKRLLDQGAIDYEEVMFALKLCKFDGWYSFEEMIAAPDPEKTVAEIRHGIKHLLACHAAAPDALHGPFLTFNL